ncbi:MAG: sensor histidine kinase [Pseudomonadota bacterium]
MEHRTHDFHNWAAILTWLVVFVLSIMILRNASGAYEGILLEAITLQIAYLALLFLSVNSVLTAARPKTAKAMFLLMLAVVLLLAWRTPIEFFFIYTIMWMTIVPYYFSRQAGFVWLILVCAAWYVIKIVSWGENNAFFEVLLVGTFHLFGLLSSMATMSSAEANEKAQALNRELMATQHLLTEASKQNERTRIARDLHDLLGHHLTALTINLQVASRMTDGEAKDKVDQCHSLSKLLLSDVRDAVTTLREESSVNFTETLKLIVDNVPNLKIHLDIDPELNISDVNIAEALLRCVQEAITNTLRHSNAAASWIRIWQEGRELNMQIHDDGRVGGEVKPGNGLQGMRERIERLNGRLIIEALKRMQINVQIPIPSP